MAILVPNLFSSYQFTQGEEEQGQVLTYLQKAILQNKRSEIATSRLNLDFDVNNVQKFIQDEAFIKGQLAVIDWLITTSDSVEEEIKLRLAANLPPDNTD